MNAELMLQWSINVIETTLTVEVTISMLIIAYNMYGETWINIIIIRTSHMNFVLFRKVVHLFEDTIIDIAQAIIIFLMTRKKE